MSCLAGFLPLVIVPLKTRLMLKYIVHIVKVLKLCLHDTKIYFTIEQNENIGIEKNENKNTDSE